MDRRQQFYYVQQFQQKDRVIQELRQELAASEGKVKVLLGQIATLGKVSEENERLHKEIAQLQEDNTKTGNQLHYQIARLKSENAKLRRNCNNTKEKLGVLEQQRQLLEVSFQVANQRLLTEQKIWDKREEQLLRIGQEQREKLEVRNEEVRGLNRELRLLSDMCHEYETMLKGDIQQKQRLKRTLRDHAEKIRLLQEDLTQTKHKVRRLIVFYSEQFKTQSSQMHQRILRVHSRAIARKNEEIQKCREDGARRADELQKTIDELSRSRQGYIVTNSFWHTVH